MATELETLIYEAIGEVGEVGSAIIKVGMDDITKAVGKIRHFGYVAALEGNGVIVITPKPPKQKTGRPISDKLFLGKELLETADPANFPTNKPKSDAQYFQYHNFYTMVRDGLLFISKSPIDKTVFERQEPNYTKLVDLATTELPGVVTFKTAIEARQNLLKLKRQLGKAALVKISQEGAAIKAEYKKVLPIDLLIDYPTETVLGWAKEQANRLGSNSACIFFGRHEKKYGRVAPSVKNFEQLIGISTEEES